MRLVGRPAERELAGPTTRRERIDALDVLRGVAVLGILTMNLVGFAMPADAYLLPTVGAVGPGERAVWAVQRLLFDQKFMSLFTMLFGAGIVLSTRRRDAAAGPGAALALHYRRIGVLFAVGMAHAYLVWDGDVLVLYAVVAVAAVGFRNLSGPAALAIGAGLFVAGGVWELLFVGVTWLDVARSGLSGADYFAPRENAREAAAMTGSYLDQVGYRLATVPEYQFGVLLSYGPRVLGQMVLGMALLKLGLFEPGRNRAGRWWLAAVGLGVGLPLGALDVWAGFATGFDPLWMFTGAFQLNYFNSGVLALGYVAIIIAAAGTLPAWLTRPVAAVGRAALSNYLLQSILCTTLFYGFGLGWRGTMGRAELIGVFLVVTAVQLAWSPLWLAAFRFGPAEWAWRSLSYGRVQPMRRRLTA